ncbi:hypothetical protein RC083_16030 [Pseudoalteromonas haloplanktis]|uniref:Uncharacterized protein n=1 Tax=Pseudoalteromonas haloplanktis TaxID=228 RepID=A0ABU1BFA8_PSEHA|nr:hypothetical protein [Pseudoalteromonas haloplanktis]MDQ9093086.1 hypothetical protein [Pseudoalteromonas haloplanktis]
MKDIITALKEARDKCTDTVDKSTIDELNKIIQQLEKMEIDNLKPIDWFDYALKAFALIKLLAGMGE